MKKERCRGMKAKTLAEIYQWLERKPAPRQWKLILAASVHHLQNQDDEDETRATMAVSQFQERRERTCVLMSSKASLKERTQTDTRTQNSIFLRIEMYCVLA